MENRAKRLFSLDLFRVVCMFLITVRHAIGYCGGELLRKDLGAAETVLLLVLESMMYVSVTGFIAISSYFLTNAKTTGKKVYRFGTQVWFYSAALFFVGIFLGEVGLGSMLKSFFPLLTAHYWYPLNYCILLLLVPYLNRLIGALEQKEHGCLLAVWFLTSAFLKHNPFFSSEVYLGQQTHSLLLFAGVYLTVAYIRVYDFRCKRSTAFAVFAASLAILMAANAIKLYNIGGLSDTSVWKNLEVLDDNSAVSLVAMLSFFLMFLTQEGEPPKWMAKCFSGLIPGVFGVYLIQEHQLIREALWKYVGDYCGSVGSMLLAVVVLFAVLLAASTLLYQLYRLAYAGLFSKLETKIFSGTGPREEK